MPNMYRPRLGAKSLQKSLRGMAQMGGTRLSDRRLKEVLIKSGDKDLKDFAYKKTGTLTKHKANKIIEKFAKQVHQHEKMDFSYSAKRQGIGQVSKSGRISQIAARNMYQDIAEKEAKADTPKGPTPQELRDQKVREERIKKRNIVNRQMAAEREERMKPKNAEKQITSISDKQKRENVGGNEGKTDKNDTHTSSIRMPVMAGGAPRTRTNPQNLEKYSGELEKRIQEKEEDGEEGQEPEEERQTQEAEGSEEMSNKEESTGPEEGQEPSSEPAESEPEPEPVDIDKGLPFSE